MKFRNGLAFVEIRDLGPSEPATSRQSSIAKPGAPGKTQLSLPHEAIRVHIPKLVSCTHGRMSVTFTL